MKKLKTILAALLISATATFAQAPQGFSYQAVVRDAQNAVVANQDVEVTLTILQGATADAAKAIFSEKHTAKTNANGLFSVTVGSVDATAFSKINWAAGNVFLKTETAYGTATTQLLSVPFAMYAEKAGSLDPTQLAQILSSVDMQAVLNFVNKTEINNTLNNYVQTSALANYTTAAHLNDTLAVYAKTADLPEGVNLTGYAKTADLADVATSGSYSDLTGTPNLKTVATTGSYNDLTDKPTIPAAPDLSAYAKTEDVPAKLSDLNADYIGDMPMATVNVTVTNVDNVATVSFLGRELKSGTNSFKVPAYSPVFLSVVLSTYSQSLDNGETRGYRYSVKINGNDFDPAVGEIYYPKPTVTADHVDTESSKSMSWGGSIIDNNLVPNPDLTTRAGMSELLTRGFRIKTGVKYKKVKIYKSGYMIYNPTGNSDDSYEGQNFDSQHNMVNYRNMENQVVGPFPSEINTIEITVESSDSEGWN
ncbi:MAG: hypothetical protein IKW77_01015 [Salinivirgaceae bacterium]|nr:hypothetical protein [Salinivirgaceae bacterium]